MEELEARQHELESVSRQTNSEEVLRAIESSLCENLAALESELTVVQGCAADEWEGPGITMTGAATPSTSSAMPGLLPPVVPGGSGAVAMPSRSFI